MAQFIHNAPDDGPKGQSDWETVTAGVDRLPVPGGWIYRTDRGVVFVPDKAQDISHHGYRRCRLTQGACALGMMGPPKPHPNSCTMIRLR
jgi:hypothetical protein